MRKIALSALLFVPTLAITLPGGSIAAAGVPGKPLDKTACVQLPSATTSDMTKTVQSYFDKARANPSHCLYIRPGNYYITKLQIGSGIAVIGDGDTSVLYAKNPANRQITVGSNSGVYDLKIYTKGTMRTNDNEALWLDDTASNLVVDNVTVDGGNGPGIMTYGAQYARITNNRLSNIKADSIHLNGNAQHIYVAGNKVRNSGDDMVAVVKYDDPNFPDRSDARHSDRKQRPFVANMGSRYHRHRRQRRDDPRQQSLAVERCLYLPRVGKLMEDPRHQQRAGSSQHAGQVLEADSTRPAVGADLLRHQIRGHWRFSAGDHHHQSAAGRRVPHRSEERLQHHVQRQHRKRYTNAACQLRAVNRSGCRCYRNQHVAWR